MDQEYKQEIQARSFKRTNKNSINQMSTRATPRELSQSYKKYFVETEEVFSLGSHIYSYLGSFQTSFHELRKLLEQLPTTEKSSQATSTNYEDVKGLWKVLESSTLVLEDSKDYVFNTRWFVSLQNLEILCNFKGSVDQTTYTSHF